jgi:hypothetical protein
MVSDFFQRIELNQNPYLEFFLKKIGKIGIELKLEISA